MQMYEILEKELAEWIGVTDVVACSSGTAALHLAFECLQLPLGSEVIVPDFCMVACARAVSMAGLVPVFADCGQDGNIDPEEVEKLITDKTKAILVVHTYGRTCEMETLISIADGQDRELLIVEDMAEVHGIQPQDYSVAACWSFYRNKIVGGEEGGAVCFPGMNVGEGPRLARSLRSQGFTESHDFQHNPRGCNYRLANCLAEKVLNSLAVYDRSIKRRREIEKIYNQRVPHHWQRPPREIPWVYDLRIPGMSSEIQNKVLWGLKQIGIEARYAFKPMHSQMEYRNHRASCRADPTCRSLAEVLSREAIYLPLSFPQGEVMADWKAKRIFDLIWQVVG